MKRAGSATDAARTVRIRVHRGRSTYDAQAACRVPDSADITAFLKRGAIAALPRAEGWHLLLVSAERTREGEAVAPVLDRLARRFAASGGARDCAAALAVTGDGSHAALAVGTRDPARLERLRSALVAMGR
jgi:hypothetical protein